LAPRVSTGVGRMEFLFLRLQQFWMRHLDCFENSEARWMVEFEKKRKVKR